MQQFSDLGLAAPIARAVAAKGYSTPTPIQLQAIPEVLGGHDLLGIAATGTGKTAAFALPILHRLSTEGVKAGSGYCHALILAPTRELAAQISESFRTYSAGTGLRTAAIFGGVPFGKQTAHLKRGADIIVATPGRLLDHLERGTLRIDAVRVLVLDEADHMLDLGFIPAVRRIVRALPKTRQTLMFSATMPKEIRLLADDMLKSPKTISVASSATPPALIDQRVIFADGAAKRRLLISILNERPGARTIVFTRTKHGADKVVIELTKARISSAAIHGNKSQGQRERALAAFKSGETPILVATDIAARGIDINGIDLVVNFDLPNVPETYVHRIGRTARAGASGLAIALCAPDERPLLKAIERVMGRTIAKQDASGALVAAANDLPEEARTEAPRSHRGGERGRHHHGNGRSNGRPQQAAKSHENRGQPHAAQGQARKKHRPANGTNGHNAQHNQAAQNGNGGQHKPRPQQPVAADSNGAGPLMRDLSFMASRAR